MNPRSLLMSIGSALGSAGLAFRLLSLPVASTVSTVLLSHELGHVVVGKMAGADVRPPLFIPLGIVFIGATRMSGVPQDSRAAIAISGPAAGVGAAAGLLVIGVLWGWPVLVWVASLAFTMEIWSGTLGADGRKYRNARRELSDDSIGMVSSSSNGGTTPAQA